MTDGLVNFQDMDSGGDPADCWPVHENVLRSLSEDVRPTAMDYDVGSDDAAVASNVQACLAEPVMPTAVTDDPPTARPQTTRDDATAAARRMQTRLMAVRSAYTDGKYYEPNAPYVSRTVEELCTWTVDVPANVHTYTAGTVDYDRDTGACHLLGLVDPRSRVVIDCSPLTATLPRHRSTVKMFATLRTREDDDGLVTPVLVPDHFQAFSCADLFRWIRKSAFSQQFWREKRKRIPLAVYNCEHKCPSWGTTRRRLNFEVCSCVSLKKSSPLPRFFYEFSRDRNVVLLFHFSCQILFSIKINLDLFNNFFFFFISKYIIRF